MKVIRFFFGCILTVIVVALVAGAVFYFDYQRFLKTPMVTEQSPKTFTVKSGDTILSLTKAFSEQNMPMAEQSLLARLPISEAKKAGNYYFRLLAKMNKKSDKLKVGDYPLQVGMTPPEVLEIVTNGKTVAYKAQFIEGRTFKQMCEVLAKNPNVIHTIDGMSDSEILTAVGERTFIFPEGLFFPDTYTFPKGAKDIQVLKLAYDLMQKNLKKAWEARDSSITLQTPYELLTLASIIEKETGVNSEREKVSGVFHRRLAKDMALQTDPSVIYGMGDSYQGTIYKSDLQTETPYNTYIHKGLTPTPIAMPSMASLMAAGQPDSGDSLFFVADGNGGHTFTTTYAEHKKAVEVYRETLKK